MVDGLVDGHLNGHWFWNGDLHVLLHWDWHWLFHVVVYLFFYLEWYWLLDGNGDGLDDGDSDGLRYMDVDGIRLWYWYCYWFGNWYWYCMRNRDADLFDYGYWYRFVDFYSMREIVATFVMASVTARISSIYGRQSAKECYAYLEQNEKKCRKQS